MEKRRHKRYNKRMEVRYANGPEATRGYTKNISEQGVFIGCRSPLPPGSEVDITAVLPEGQTASLKGIVRRNVRDRHSVNFTLNGMGVELLAYDMFYSHYLRSVVGEFVDADLSMYAHLLKAPLIRAEEIKNIREYDDGQSKADAAPSASAPEPEFLIVPCPNCGTKNKVRRGVAGQMPKCGRCRMFLLVAGA